jgi:hypothetical protein
MSSLVFPKLTGQRIEVGYEPSYSTTIHTSASGKEQRTSWRSAPRRTFTISYKYLRNNVAAPSPYGANSETGVVLSFLDTHKGAWDSFLLPDPMGGSNVRVRFVEDSLEFEQIVSGSWRLSKLKLIEVL